MDSDKEFISLSEAARLANVSSMTIRRFAKKLQATGNPDDACSVKVLTDKNPYGKKYYIAKDKVMSAFNVTGVNSQVNETVITNGNEGLTSLLSESITVLKDELDRKNETIKRLIGEVSEYRKAQTESARANRLTKLLKYPAEKIELVRRLISGETTNQEKKTIEYIEPEFTQQEPVQVHAVIDGEEQTEQGIDIDTTNPSQNIQQ
jgi:hypothetical protein